MLKHILDFFLGRDVNTILSEVQAIERRLARVVERETIRAKRIAEYVAEAEAQIQSSLEHREHAQRVANRFRDLTA